MKKYKNFLLIIIVIMLIPFLLKIIKKDHIITYKKNNYEINEKFSIKEKQHKYQFTIKNKNEKYTFFIEENLNKNKKVIKEIEKYKEGNITCIIPKYIRKKLYNTYCLEDNKQVSNYYLKDNENYKKILNKIKKYKINPIKTSDKKIKYKNIDIYQNNIIDNYAYIIWNYKGIYILKNNEILSQKFLDYDLYDNIMSTVTSRYFVLFENTSVNGIENVHCYDLKKDKYKLIKLEDKISKDSYINGVYQDKIYITDKRKKVQYTLDVKKEKLEEVGNEELDYIKYRNGKEELLNKSDFFLEEVYFNNYNITDKNIDSTDISEENNTIYYKKDNSFYKRYENNDILLFNLDNVKEWSIQDKDILLLQANEVYLYNENNGLNKILEFNELNYNYKNIIRLWK